jgi:hypothetical protein
MNAIQNCQKEKIEINFVLPLCLGNTARRDRVKGVLVNTPIFTWAYTRTLKERGKREIRNLIDIGSFFQCKGMLCI